MKSQTKQCKGARVARRLVRELYPKVVKRIKWGEERILTKVRALDETVDIVARNLQHAIRTFGKGREE